MNPRTHLASSVAESMSTSKSVPKSKRVYPADRRTIAEFEALPNIGVSLAEDLRSLGFSAPAQLIGEDPYALYDRLCVVSGERQDPCVADVFIATVRFMEGAPPHPWWHYTAERKVAFSARAPNA
jgi:hypothetical protein